MREGGPDTHEQKTSKQSSSLGRIGRDGAFAALAQCSGLSWSEEAQTAAAAATAAWQAAGWLLSEPPKHPSRPLSTIHFPATPPPPVRFTRSVVLRSDPRRLIGCEEAALDWPPSL